jgi:outer membrane protein
MGKHMAIKARTALVLSILALAAALVPAIGYTQAIGLKIGVVDAQRLLKESPQAKSTIKKLEEEFAPRQKELVAKTNEMKSREEKLQKDGAVMGAEERRNAEEKLRNDERDLSRRQNEFIEDVNLKKNEELGKLQADLVNEVRSFAKQKGYDLIVSDGVLFASPTIDVTKQILDNLEANYKSKAGGKN